MDLKAAVDGFRAETGPAEQVSFAGPDIAIRIFVKGNLFQIIKKEIEDIDYTAYNNQTR